MTNRIDGIRVAILATNGVEQVELTTPMKAAVSAGARVELIASEPGEIHAMHHDDKGDTFHVDRTTDAVSADDFDALLIPGGVASPDRLRRDEAAVKLVRTMAEAGKPIASICHGPWMLVEADVLEGRTVTSWPSLQTDIRNAGGRWVDEPVHVDSGIVTSRKPDDLDAFCEKMLEEFGEGVHDRSGTRPSLAQASTGGRV